MDDLSREEVAMLASIKKICDKVVSERAAEIDETDEFPRDVFDLLAEQGVFAMFVPEEYGGIGVSARCWVDAVALLAEASVAVSCLPVIESAITVTVSEHASEAVKAEVLPRIASGEAIICGCLTEPGAGSYVRGVATTARRDGDCYVLDGAKQFITGGSVADYFEVFAQVVEDGQKKLTCFLLSRDTPGLVVAKDEKKLGLHGSVTTQLFFEGARVPVANMIGDVGDGYRLAYDALDVSRTYVAAMGVGIARAAFKCARDYSMVREQGKRICEYQMIQEMLANMEIGIEASTALVHDVARLIDAGKKPIKQASCAKVFCSETAFSIASDAVQILGGNGYCREYPAERIFRDARGLPIFEGTNQIQRLIIAKEVLAS